MKRMEKFNRSFFVVPAVFLAVFLFSGCSDQANTKLQPVKPPTPINRSSVAQPTAPVRSMPVVEYNEPEIYEEPTFNGYECTGDCSGHEAGYEWAEEQGITDSSDCGGNSNSFIEGCESYADEQQADSYESGYDDSGYDY